MGATRAEKEGEREIEGEIYILVTSESLHAYRLVIYAWKKLYIIKELL